MLTLACEVDALSAGLFRDAIEDAAGLLGDRILVLDLRGVTFLSSLGLHVLAATATALQRDGGEPVLRVVAERRVVRRTIELTGLDAILRLHDDIEDALAP